MSQFRGGNFNVGTIPTTTVSTDERHSAPKSTQNQVPRHSAENSVDGSEESFSAYLAREDKKIKRAERQSANAHDIRVSAALLSATVATFIGASIRGLQMDPLDKWAFYLTKTYELLSEDNRPASLLPPSTLVDPSKFSPANSVVLINSFWFLSLVVGLTCILLSSLAQRWANDRKFDLAAQPRTQPRNSGAFSASVGAGDKSDFPWLIEALPFLLRLSLAFFFAGFGVFVFNLTAEFGTAQALLLTSGSLISPLLYFWHI